ncbi:unnamed protein product [Dovyalis caffra]|uniref:GDSL esterase/lipase n=1 Tax=Dovyalis caffra TaxID=77055 RepID=A0AAV1QZB4_9ROSI|nr:unnamed protein product [Dovyalis caffra]
MTLCFTREDLDTPAAQYMRNIKTPVNYAQKEEVSKSELRGGMNFAFAGSGVLDVSFSPFPLKMQVDKFREQIEQNVYTKIDLENSVALVSYTGNDYMYKTKKGGGTLKDVFDLTKTVVDLLTKNLREIRDLGVQKIAIFGTPPRGCFPDYYIELLQSCDETWNEASRWHNKLLEESLQDLNKESNGSKFVYLDLYNAFISALFNKNKGTTGYEDRFKACCQGGPMECFSFALAKKKCDHPELSIFWDGAHPSQYGANAGEFANSDMVESKQQQTCQMDYPNKSP